MKVYLVYDHNEDGAVGIRETQESARSLADDVIAAGITEVDVEEWDTEELGWGYAEVSARFTGGEWHRFVEGTGWVPEEQEARND